jgi:hypothetical protein
MADQNQLAEINVKLGNLDSKLSDFNALLKTHIEMTGERISNHRNTLDRHSHELYGEGNDESPGIKTKIDRLIQEEKSRKVILGTIGTATIGLVVKAVWALFQK